jgi:hypothetical protein
MPILKLALTPGFTPPASREKPYYRIDKTANLSYTASLAAKVAICVFRVHHCDAHLGERAY